jgi:hypothetical protein
LSAHEFVYGICKLLSVKFDPGDVKHVAVHEKLKGDKILGEGEMMRFSANRFADSGVALDPMGIPAIDKACPHCHHLEHNHRESYHQDRNEPTFL